MNINKLIQRDKRIDSDVKLTKAGEQWAEETDSSKVIEKANFTTPEKLNLNEFLGLSLNPLLKEADIKHIFKLLKIHNDIEKDDKTIKDATKTRNSGTRGQIRKHLAEHPNAGTEIMKNLVVANRMGKPRVLHNPAITDEVLNFFFEKKVMTTAQGGYSFISFGELMKAKNITPKLVMEWYGELKKYADWSYKDNQWYAVVNALIEYDNCPFEILKDIASAPAGDLNDGWDRAEKNRSYAVEHANATDELKAIAYEITQQEEYLPQMAKDVFLF